MLHTAALLALAIAGVRAQQAGTLTAETHPSLSWSTCTAGGSCTPNAGKITLDANWRWLHSTSGSTNCYTGNTWDKTLCPDAATCTTNCALDGADYSGTYGITTSGSALTLKFVTQSAQKNVGSRVYLLDTDSTYHLFKPNNREFTFDVDVSQLPCGLNGAVYFSQMDADGGMARFPTNKAGAKYGTGYCDSQCPRDLKFINGQANNVGWNGTSANSGKGNYGSCCNEMDIWEANSVSAAYTPHPCSGAAGATQCTGADCGATSTQGRYGGFCDPDGCDFNSYRQGDTTFYGKGLKVDTTKPFTIVTQFLTADGTDTGTLSEIKRFYVQNGVVIPNSSNKVAGIDAVNSITEKYCAQQKTAFGDTNEFDAQGGLKTIGSGFNTGTVLVLSVWDDYDVNMLWLDSDYPTTASPTAPGVARGSCPTTSGKPADVESSAANASVTYSNIKFGPIGSTFASGGTTTGAGSSTAGTSSSASTKTTSTTSKTTTSSASSATQTKYGQCGGTGYSGPTVCASGSTCTAVSPPYFYQCL